MKYGNLNYKGMLKNNMPGEILNIEKKKAEQHGGMKPWYCDVCMRPRGSNKHNQARCAAIRGARG